MNESSLAETSEDVVEDTAVLEVLDLHVGVQSHLHLEGLPASSSHLDGLVHLQVALADVDAEGFLSGQA